MTVDVVGCLTGLGGVIGRPSRLGRLSRGRYHPTVPVATAAATSEPNTRLRFVVAAFTILSLHGSVPKGFPDSTSVFSVGVDPVIRDGTSYHPDVPGTPTPTPHRHGHGCGSASDSHRLPQATRASTHFSD